jgi:polyhydroxyalkanoate synthesis regulator phasin
VCVPEFAREAVEDSDKLWVDGIAIRNEADRELVDDIRKADVDKEGKEMRLQGPKDQLVLSDDPDAEELRQEVEALEQPIAELSEFKPGTEAGS